MDMSHEVSSSSTTGPITKNSLITRIWELENELGAAKRQIAWERVKTGEMHKKWQKSQQLNHVMTDTLEFAYSWRRQVGLTVDGNGRDPYPMMSRYHMAQKLPQTRHGYVFSAPQMDSSYAGNEIRTGQGASSGTITKISEGNSQIGDIASAASYEENTVPKASGGF